MRRWRPIYGRPRCNPRWMKSVLSAPGTVSLISERSGSSGSASRVLSSAGRRITSAIITNSTVTDRYSRPFRLGDGCGFPSACPKPYSVATNTRHVSGLDTPRHISNSVFPGSPPLSSISRHSLADRGSRLSRFSIRRRPYFHPANLLQRADNAVGQTACPAVCTSWTSGTSRSWGGI